MTPIEYIRAAYQYRAELKVELTAAALLGLIISYHAMTSPLLNWLGP
jgi:hypothetical protein